MAEIAFYRSRDERGSRVLAITFDGDSIRIGGQDLGPAVSAAFGDDFREYEWDWTMRAKDMHRAIEVLGGSVPHDIVDALRRWAEANQGRDPGQFLSESGLELGFWSRIGD